jgi:hypothetical protein
MSSSVGNQFLHGGTSGHTDRPDDLALVVERLPNEENSPSDAEDEPSEDQDEDDEDEDDENDEENYEEEERPPKRDLVAELAETINEETSTFSCGGVLMRLSLSRCRLSGRERLERMSSA